jgi:hypothetical protein
MVHNVICLITLLKTLFIKLDNVTVDILLESILKSATLRFTAGVQNVLTLTKYNGQNLMELTIMFTLELELSYLNANF